MPEATPEFKRQLREAFEEMYVGQTFEFRRTFTDGDVAMFCGVTGDYNPYHQDAAFAEQSFYGRLTIPGLLTGSMLTHIGGLLGFLATEMSFDYLGPVFVGDTISCNVTIAEKDEEKRRVKATAGFVNQDDVEVLRAMFAGFPSRVRLAR
ncbi:MAG: MaoC family protein [uncultured Rubrobacteraceae bacterium]|uniref:MaoC family protein n=1 Tax=uncultured Rubrobacteraceae bacterium TaxID=349277 RepID=A0A6J4QYI8_9ACTN|nr:MAG: MaoC family protein [uncultured Rubrobacteraceae bacterium]